MVIKIYHKESKNRSFKTLKNNEKDNLIKTGQNV